VTAGELLEAAQSFPVSSLEQHIGEGGLVVVAPHPDDESLGCGGLIAEARAEGRRTRVVVVSDGTGSHPASKAYPKERLRDLRENEARKAVGCPTGSCPATAPLPRRRSSGLSHLPRRSARPHSL
jgi:hypothetical protein